MGEKTPREHLSRLSERGGIYPYHPLLLCPLGAAGVPALDFLIFLKSQQPHLWTALHPQLFRPVALNLISEPRAKVLCDKKNFLSACCNSSYVPQIFARSECAFGSESTGLVEK